MEWLPSALGWVVTCMLVGVAVVIYGSAAKAAFDLFKKR